MEVFVKLISRKEIYAFFRGISLAVFSPVCHLSSKVYWVDKTTHVWLLRTRTSVVTVDRVPEIQTAIPKFSGYYWRQNWQIKIYYTSEKPQYYVPLDFRYPIRDYLCFKSLVSNYWNEKMHASNILKENYKRK